ncbi:hypothetical protein [uncultured Mediterranean phage]|nr:hypothetical protein [uncultured Mediterranean phage]
MNLLDTSIRWYAHLPNEALIMQEMLHYIIPNEDLLLATYRKYRPTDRYQALKDIWYHILPEEHSCKKDLCVEMLDYVLNMHECKRSREKNKKRRRQ